MLMLCLSMIEDARDRFAFEDIFRSTEKDLVNYINTLVHNKNDAEDIAQEAWLCVSRNIESFRVNHYKSVKNYVFLVARYRTYDFVESIKQTEDYFEDINVASNFARDEDSVFLQFCAMAGEEEITECILSLPPIYRDVLNLHFLAGDNLRQVADILNLNYATVRQRAHRGRDMLMFVLRERGVL